MQTKHYVSPKVSPLLTTSPRHATDAITSEAIARMEEHKAAAEDSHKAVAEDSPLFLYVSYNAAHSPLQVAGGRNDQMTMTMMTVNGSMVMITMTSTMSMTMTMTIKLLP